MFGLPDIPNLGPLLLRGVEALERLADAQEQANRLAIGLDLELPRKKASKP